MASKVLILEHDKRYLIIFSDSYDLSLFGTVRPSAQNRKQKRLLQNDFLLSRLLYVIISASKQ